MTDSINLLACSGKSILSKLIKLRTNGPYSHIAYLLPNSNICYCKNVPIVVEAWRGWVRIADINFSHRSGTNYDIFNIPCTLAQKMAFERFVLEQVYKKYDFRAMLNFLLNPVYDPILDKTNEDKENPTKWFCSELIMGGLAKSGILNGTIKPSFTDPNTLMRLLVGNKIATFVSSGVTHR